MAIQHDLFGDPGPAIPGLTVVENAVPPHLAHELERRIDAAPLAPFRFGQWEGKRLTASYGSAYDYQRGQVTPAPPLPAWLAALRERLAPLAGLEPHALVQALVIRYDPGAGIGWHRDRPQYGEVVGLSLTAPATLRLRRRRAQGDGFARRAVPLEPRALYRLSGEVRELWEHSIAPMAQTRRSVTFRTMR
ncbi:alpha-ketoglutarate-dependent dioxygenase AlkB [Aurantiacibacter spongiae]|uniref:Alpha-ketoglutarate-dependent dioxygenase AlkB n=2 Tax=Aurantiacibacter spongiae TaxID=2488860 RepID=A0A3N5DTP4_9SPHN|nr:alpha-ketoglutarate-dependent dioxygenase AlkB [Aurantiacibacter spongiae]